MRPASEYTTDNAVAELEYNSREDGPSESSILDLCREWFKEYLEPLGQEKIVELFTETYPELSFDELAWNKYHFQAETYLNANP